MSLNRILIRQLKKNGMDIDTTPTSIEDWKSFLDAVSKSYDENESQRILKENLIDVSTNEMNRLYKSLEEKSKNEILEQEEKLHSVIEAVPSIVAWMNSKGEIQGVNESLKKALSRTTGEIISKNFDMLGWGMLHLSILEFVVDLTASERTIDIDLNTSLGERIFKIGFKKFSENKMVVLVAVDITGDRKKQMELEEARAKSMSSARMAVLGEMASGVAHEINNPMAVINFVINQIRKNALEEKYDGLVEKTDKIIKTIQRVTKIISGLRNFARDGENDPFDPALVKQIVDDAIELSQQRLKNMDIELRLDEIPVDFKIDCRSTQIMQVVLNLISNSRDAISQIPEKWIEIKFKDLGDRIQLKIIDCGLGISKEVREKIFQPFFTTKEVGVGTGLGLSISVGIINSHHGKLYYDEASLNTAFVIELPKRHQQI